MVSKIWKQRDKYSEEEEVEGVRVTNDEEKYVKVETDDEDSGGFGERVISETELERERKIRDIVKGSFIGEILKEDGVTDVSFDGFTCFAQHNKKGQYEADVQPEEEEVHKLIRQLSAVQGLYFTDSSPILDTEIAGYRINAVHRVLSPFGVTMSLRVSKPYRAIQNLSDLANEELAGLLGVLVTADTNMVISGQTGSGKTELQKLLVGYMEGKKISLMEDTMDSHIKLLYPKFDINSWRTRTGEGIKNKIGYRELIKAGLRNNPDWLLIAEIRGAEAYDFIESALTGHSVLTTIHAHGAEAIPSRIRNMIGQEYDVNPVLLGQDIVNNIRFGLHMEMVRNKKDGSISRRIRELVEYISYEDTGVVSRNIYKVGKKLNEETGEYTEYYEMNPITKKTADILRDKELYHLLPDVFKEKK